MYGMTYGNSYMMWGTRMWGMGWGGVLGCVVIVLGIAALIKYLFFNIRR
jgi:hypothetical protein